MNPRDTQIRVAAARFRLAIQQAKDKLGESFRYFPLGACGDASVLLGMYLTEEGFGEFEYVSGERYFEEEERHATHAWLAQGSLIVDITADQFYEIDNPVMVTRVSEWHSGFEGRPRHIAHARAYDDQIEADYKHLYAIVLDEVKRSNTKENGRLVK